MEINGEYIKYKIKSKTENQRIEKQTNTGLPIHDNVVFVRKGEENDGEKLVAFFTSTSPRQPILLHSLVFLLGEVVEPTIPLEIITHLFEIQSMYIQNGVIPHVTLIKKIVNLHQKST